MTEEQQSKNFEALSRPFKKRVDIGLVTGVSAVIVSIMALFVSRAQMMSYQRTQKAAVMPVIDIDMGYMVDGEGKDYFEISLNNAGSGVAYIQRVKVTQNGEPFEDYAAFEDAIMTRRMRSWAKLTARPASGYLRSGERIVPRRYFMGAARTDLPAYLRGEWGAPVDGVDVTICYCSVFEDCWTKAFLDRKRPQPVESCGAGDVPDDDFLTYIMQRKTALAQGN